MIATLEPITVKPIEKKAGFCASCSRFRYCEYESGNKILCPGCITCLRNQKSLIVEAEEILPKNKTSKQPKQPKIKQPKQIKIKQPKQPKIKQPRKIVQKKVCNFLQANKMGFFAKDIAQKFKVSHKYAWEILSSLVKSGEVVPSVGRKRNKIYAHVSHAEILQKYQGLRLGCRSNMAEIISALHGSDKVIATADIYSLIEGRRSKSTIIACLRFMVQEDEALTYFDHSLDCEMFASAINENAVKNFQETSRQTENKILAFLKTGTKSRQQIATYLGKNPRSIKAISKILSALQDEGKVELVHIDRRGSFAKLSQLSRESI